MAKKKRNNKTTQIAAPIREFLRQTVKQKIRTKADREALAEFLGQAPSSVSNLLKGEGGLDTWVAALVFCYGLKPESLLELLGNFQALARRQKPTESDRLAAQINLPEAKRKVLFSAILTALALEENGDSR